MKMEKYKIRFNDPIYHIDCWGYEATLEEALDLGKITKDDYDIINKHNEKFEEENDYE